MCSDWFPDLSTRTKNKEIMDGGDIDEKKAYRTLVQFKMINLLVSRSRTLMREIFVPHMLKAGKRRITLLDIGAGGGDIAIWYANLCRSHGIDIKIICLDNDPRAIAFANELCRGFNNIIIRQGSAHDIETLGEDIDYVFANHFLHHLDTPDIAKFLEQVYKCARRGFLINDLIRSQLAHLGFTFLAGIFFRGSYHFHDGRISIRKGFTFHELKEMVGQLGFSNCIKIGKKMPARIFLYCLRDNYGFE